MRMGSAEQHGFIRGTYTRHETGKSMDAWLLIDFDTYESSGVWAAQGKATVGQVRPGPADTFEPAT